jgi:hypothetical protein
VALFFPASNSAEIYDWKAESFSIVKTSVPNTIGAASLLDNGNVFIAGNEIVQLYRPKINGTVDIGTILGQATSATTLDDLVLVVEIGPSVSFPTTQLYSTKSNSFIPAGTGGLWGGPPVSGMSATKLNSDSLLFLGGFNNGPGNAEIIGEAQLYPIVR